MDESTCRELEWDSEFWGHPVFQADDPIWVPAAGCMFLLLGADETDAIHRAEERGFRIMDIRVELERRTLRCDVSDTRRWASDDINTLARIARESHRITRFYADPRFPDARCDDLYETWIRNSCSGWADAVYVAGPVGRPYGYVTVHVDDELSTLGLIAVDEETRGVGWGEALVDAALNGARESGATKMCVVTQARNIGALRLFERCGFRVVKTGVWLHRWADGDG